MIEQTQEELDEFLKLIKVDLSDPKLSKDKPDFYREAIHVLEKKESMARSSVSTNKDEYLKLSLERFE